MYLPASLTKFEHFAFSSLKEENFMEKNWNPYGPFSNLISPFFFQWWTTIQKLLFIIPMKDYIFTTNVEYIHPEAI